MIDIKNIYLKFNKVLIQNSEIQIPDNKITILSGVSGTGKSTFVYDLLLLSNNTNMTYTINGKDVYQYNKEELQKYYFSFVPQTILLFPFLSLMDNIKMFSLMTHDTFDEQKAKKYLTDFQLFHDANTQVSTLSGGEKQRLMIVCALMKDTEYIFMDEPTAYLDENNVNIFLKILKKLKNDYGKTIFVVSHDERISRISDCHYEVINKKIVCKKKIDSVINLSSKKLSNAFRMDNFIKEKIKNEKVKYLLINFLLTVAFTLCTLFISYNAYYKSYIQNQLNNMISNQLVVDISDNVNGKILNDIARMENVDNIKKLHPIISDNFYQIIPYFSTHDFKASLINNKAVEDIYINFDNYRQNKNNNICVTINDKKYTLIPKYVLDQKYQGYKYDDKIIKCIYVPYKLYETFIDELSLKNNTTSSLIIEISDKNVYIDTLKSLIKSYPSIRVLDKGNIINMIEIQDTVQKLSTTLVKVIYIIILLTFVVIKLIDYYQFRLSETLLNINGITHRNFLKFLFKMELKFIIVAASTAFLIMCFIGTLLNTQIISFMLITLKSMLLMSVSLLIIFIMLYELIYRKYSSVKVIKSV